MLIFFASVVSICYIVEQKLASTELGWANWTIQWNISSNVQRRELRHPCELNAVTPGPRISVLSYIQMQKHKWQHSLLNKTLMYSIMLGLWIRRIFHLNIKLKCFLSHRFSFKTTCINIFFHFSLTRLITNPQEWRSLPW